MGRKKKEPKDETVRINSTVENTVCRQIAAGMFLAEVCELAEGKLRTPHDLIKHAQTHPAFKLALSIAHVALFNHKMAEHNKISQDIMKRRSEGVGKDEMEILKLRAKSLEFQIQKIAPMLTDYFKQASQVDVKHSGTVTQAMQIVNFGSVDVAAEVEKAKKGLADKSFKH